jgi:hypothetical protein
MALDAAGRTRVWAQAMRQAELGTLDGMTKADLRAAIDATDDWIEAAQGALPPPTGYNAALPLTARTGMTAPQKTLLFCWVAMRRAGLLPTAEG